MRYIIVNGSSLGKTGKCVCMCVCFKDNLFNIVTEKDKVDAAEAKLCDDEKQVDRPSEKKNHKQKEKRSETKSNKSAELELQT